MGETLLYGGTVLTMDEAQPCATADEAQPCATALLLRDGRVRAVGRDAEVLRLRGEGTEVVDLAGRTVCPGFIDAHHHLTHAAWCQLGVDLAGCRSTREVMSRIAAARDDERTGPWLYAYNYAPRRFAARVRSQRATNRLLTRYDLDEAAGERPVLAMHFSLHEAVVSSTGLRLAGINRGTPDPLGGRIVRDRRGEPTGELLETAVGPVEALARAAAGGTGYEEWVAALERYAQGLLRAGITHVCDPGVDEVLERYLRRAAREGRLPLPVTMLFVSRRGLFQPPDDRLDGPASGERIDGLPVGALKLFADGGSRCASCAGLLESLAGLAALAGRAVRLRRPGLLLAATTPDRPRLAPDGTLYTGYLHYRPDDLAALCARAQNRGFGLAIHAACNRAVDVVLDVLERLPGGQHGNRVEHLVSLDRRQAARLGGSGAIGVVQPAYIPLLGDEWEAMPVPPRLHSIPLRDLLDAGVTLAGSSDAPIAPYAPLLGMAAAVTRRTASGLIHQEEQRVTPLEALRMWTTGAARAAYAEGEMGVLRAGARADVVVLSANPLETDPRDLVRIRVERTIIGGKTVYAHD